MTSRAWMLGVLCLMSASCSQTADDTSAQREPILFDASQRSATGAAGMVVSAHPLVSSVGAKVLKQGGNAVDAAIAMQFALNVVEPQYSGIGGGGFMMVYEAATGAITVVDSRERAPATATGSMFLDATTHQPIPFVTRQTLGLAVGVPGTPMGIAAAHQRWGSLDMPALVNPAIHLAREGVPVNFVLATDIGLQKYKFNDAAKSVFTPNGVPLVEGDLLVQPDLARTLARFRDGGVTSFYQGDVADAVIATAATRGGTMTAADMSGYTLTFDDPVRANWNGFEVVGVAPPSSGGLTTLQILLLTHEKGISNYQPRETLRYHVLTEATRLAFADRAKFVGDPGFVSVPVNDLLAPSYITARAGLISTAAAMTNVVGGTVPANATPWPDSTDTFMLKDIEAGQTTHFTVADAAGNIVAWTSTIEQAFGTGMVVPGYGYFLNNEVTDFNATPTGPNQAAPNKRPMSSMSPVIVLKNGKPVLTVGASGGPRIIAAVNQVMQDVYEHGMSLADAVDEPRIFGTAIGTAASAIMWQDTSLWIPGGASVPLASRQGLAALGHVPAATAVARGFLGVVQAIAIDPQTGVYTGVADRQRQASAIGLSADE